MIKELLNWIFPAHEWEYREQDNLRVCKICGRQDELDMGSGMAGSQWVSITPGKKKAHAGQPA
jgi:hypothetical protein